MTVHFIGAGPGAPDLLTLRGRNLIAQCDLCLYAGSLVPDEILAHCPPHAQRINTAPLNLEEIIKEIKVGIENGASIVRLHSGDLSVWSAMGEQLRRLRLEGIPYTLTPGVPSFAAAAAALETELTLPGVAQSVVLTRTSGRASKMPKGETLENFAKTGATLAIHLSIQVLADVVEQVTPHFGPKCPCAVIFRATWPEQKIFRGSLDTIINAVDPDIERTALILVGNAIGSENFENSRLYAEDYDRRYRPTNARSNIGNEKA